MNTSRMQLLSFVILSMHCLLLHSMEIVESECNKQLLEVVAYNIPHEYEAQRVCAGVNKKYNKIIEDTYRQDKKRIQYAMQEKNIVVDPDRISWNRDFSRCTWINKPTDNNKHWELVLMGIKSNDVLIKLYLMQEGSAPVFYEYPRSFFTKNGEAFCHMYTYTTEFSRITYLPSTAQNIVQSKYDFSGHIGDIVCLIGMDEDRAPWMVQMLNYPYCIRDFLRSTDVTIVDNPTHGCVKQYHIRGVTVSSEYKGFEKYSPGGGIDYCGYSVLPEYFREVMDDLFFKQQSVKNNDKKEKEGKK